MPKVAQAVTKYKVEKDFRLPEKATKTVIREMKTFFVETQDWFVQATVLSTVRWLVGDVIDKNVFSDPILKATIEKSVHLSMIKADSDALLLNKDLKAPMVSCYVAKRAVLKKKLGV